MVRFPTKLSLVTEMINHWLTAASNPLKIHALKQKYSSHSASQSKTGSWGRGEVKEHRERSRCKWKLSTGLQRFANMNPDVAQKDSQSAEWRVPWWSIPVHGAAPQEMAMAVSLAGVWFYIPSLCWPEALDRNVKHWSDCAPQSCRGGEHAGIQHCLRLYTDSQHTRQKRFTHPVKRETVTCSSQGKPTLVFMDIFSFIDHRLSGSGFGCVHERVRVCLSVIPNKSFSTLNLTAISILILIVCLDVLEGFDV